MSGRVHLLLICALALLTFSFHIRLKKEPDERLIQQISEMTSRSRDWLGKYPPEFELQTLENKRFKLSEHIGKEVVILNFFATWCAPCRTEMPELQKFHSAHAGQPVTLVGIDAYETPNLVRKFQQDLKLTFPIAIADEGLVAAFGVKSFPTTVVIDASGRVALYELSMIANADVTLEPPVRAALEDIAAKRSVTQKEFIEAAAHETRPGGARPSGTGPQLTGRALQIAKTMDCVCGCNDTLMHCSCATATKMKKKLQQGEFAGKNDAQIKTELNAEFCMKGME